MRQVTNEELAEILEVMTISHSIDSGFAITHFGQIAGQQAIAISTRYAPGKCYFIQ